MGTHSQSCVATAIECCRCGQQCGDRPTYFRGVIYCTHCWHELQRLGIADWLPSAEDDRAEPMAKEEAA